MINIHVYGHLKYKFDPSARLSEQTIVQVPNVKGECFADFLERISLHESECGDCFVNAKIATADTLIPDGARVALFPLGMHLLCGGQHLKGHGFITKKTPKKVDYY